MFEFDLAAVLEKEKKKKKGLNRYRQREELGSSGVSVQGKS